MARWVELLGIVVFCGFSSVFGMQTHALWSGIWDVPTVVASAVAAYAAADFVSGMVHLFCDNFFSEDTPLLGRLIGPFREHHRDPTGIARRSIAEVSNSSCWGVIGTYCLVLSGGLPDSLFASTFWLGFGCSVYLTNAVHRWTHSSRVPRAVVWLQGARVFMRPDAHDRHHRTGTAAYCVLAGWLNPLLDAIPEPRRSMPRRG